MAEHAWAAIRGFTASLLCLVLRHKASRRRAHLSSTGAYTSVCQRCKIRLVRDGAIWRPAPAAKP